MITSYIQAYYRDLIVVCKCNRLNRLSWQVFIWLETPKCHEPAGLRKAEGKVVGFQHLLLVHQVEDVGVRIPGWMKTGYWFLRTDP